MTSSPADDHADRMMNVHLFAFTCASCGTTFRDVGMLAPSGRLILRGEGTGVAIAVDTWSDPVFQEVRDLVASVAPDGLAPRRLGQLVQVAFSAACDTDDAGLPYSVDALPRCPSCGSNRMSRWQATEPPVFVEDELREATHDTWRSLSQGDRTARMRAAVADALSS